MSEAITAERFKAATGLDPQDDDLDRCNCPHAGAIGHQHCGWDHNWEMPQFMLPPLRWNGKPMPALTDA